MKVLIADKFEKIGLDVLSALGCDLVYEPESGAERLPALLHEESPAVLVVRSTKVPSATIAAARGLKLIIRAGAGVDNIDVKAATAAGVKVANCPGMNAVAVAELTMALLLECDRRIADQTASARSGQWNKKEFSKARGLKGRTLGVVGCGAIGRAVIKRALAFEMKVIAWSRGITQEHAADLGAEWAGTDTPALHAMAGRCDAVTIHLPGAPDTVRLIGREFFAAMKPGAYLVNTSRGSVVDEAALCEAIASKGLRAGLDVYEAAPAGGAGPWDAAVTRNSGVYCSHHVGASTDQAQDAIAREATRVVEVFMRHGRVENCVNP
jgi:D-3-phosphoglycerate dehydrogenase